MFASKVDSGGAPPPPPPLGGSYNSGSNRNSEILHRETTGNGSSSLQEPVRDRKLSSGSAGNDSAAPANKSKWMTAFKSIKSKKEPDADR